jgi:hypothetical protein
LGSIKNNACLTFSTVDAIIGAGEQMEDFSKYRQGLLDYESKLMEKREKVLNEMLNIQTQPLDVFGFGPDTSILEVQLEDIDFCLKMLRHYMQTGEVK